MHTARLQPAHAYYFTFPDRGFRYECRGCGNCCKGHGIGIDATAGELVQLVAKRPELAAFVRRRGDATTAFNPRDRCWFLEDSGLCRIEVEDGRAAKPAACRLFPFNRVFRAGAYTVVDFNSVICPLAVAPASDGVAHADIVAEIETLRDPGLVGAIPPRDRVLAAESAAAPKLFAAAAAGDLDAGWAAMSAAPLEQTHAAMFPAFAALLGMTPEPPSAQTLSAALYLAPSLRFNELYGPRRYTQPFYDSPEHLARMWLAWLGFVSLGERLAKRALGLQELTTLWSEQATLAFAISRWDARPAMKPGPVELPASDPGGLVKRLGQRLVDNRRAKSLGELVIAAFGDAEPSSKIAALRAADPLVRAAAAC